MKAGKPVGRVLLKLLYWMVVLAISLALVAALITFLESRDGSQIDVDARAAQPPGSWTAPLVFGGTQRRLTSGARRADALANTTIRSAALYNG